MYSDVVSERAESLGKTDENNIFEAQSGPDAQREPPRIFLFLSFQISHPKFGL